MALMYRCPGPHAGPEGKTYEFKSFPSEKDGHAAGFFLTLPEAVKGKVDDPIVVIPADDAPPTRDELKAKAKELGLTFDGRISDRGLAELIAKALEG